MTTWGEDVVAHLEAIARHAQAERVQMSAQVVGVATRSDHAAPRLAYIDRRTQEAPAGPPCPACGRATTRREVSWRRRLEDEARERVFFECAARGFMFGGARSHAQSCGFGWYEDEDEEATSARLAAYRERHQTKVERLRAEVQAGTYQVDAEGTAEAMLRRAGEGGQNRPRERREEGEDMPRGSKVNEVKRAQIEEMLRAGKSHREITQALACSSSTIYVVRKATGLIGRVSVSAAQEAEAAGSPPHPHQEAEALIEAPRQITIGPPISPVPLGHHPQRECPWIRQAITRLREMPLGDYLSQTPEVRAAIDVLAGMS